MWNICDYETKIEESDSIIAKVPEIKFDVKTIVEIYKTATNEVIDLIAIVTFVEDVNKFTAKSMGRHLKKREITLQDQTGSIKLVLWNEMTEIEYEKGTVLLILNGKINKFQNRKMLQQHQLLGLK